MARKKSAASSGAEIEEKSSFESEYSEGEAPQVAEKVSKPVKSSRDDIRSHRKFDKFNKGKK